MVIRTKETRLTKGRAIWILVRNMFRQTQVAAFIIFFIAVLQITRYLFQSDKEYFPLGPVSAAAYVIMLFASAYVSVTFSKKNRASLQKGHWEISPTFLTACFEDGSRQQIDFKDVRRVIKTKAHYQLLVSGNRLIWFPLSEFFTKEDIEKFETLLKQKRLIRD